MKSRITQAALALVLLSSAVFTGCKKDDDNDSQAVTKENLAGTYTLASMKFKMTGIPEKDVTNDDQFTEKCQRDDQFTLKSDMSAKFEDLGVQCSPAGNYTSSWALSGSKITIDGDEATVKSLTKSSLVVEVTETNSGITATVTTTFNRK
jgi:hypothetical protein